MSSVSHLKERVRGVYPSTLKAESSTVKQTIAAVAMLLLGAVLTIGFRDFEGPGFTQSRAAFLLGTILLLGGIGTLVFGSKQAVIVDTKSRRVIVESRSRFRQS